MYDKIKRDKMIWIAVYSKGLHVLAGVLFLAPLLLTLCGSRLGRITTIFWCLYLFWLAWLLHIVLDMVQKNIF